MSTADSTVAPDGSPVGLYLRLPERTAEADLLHRLLPPGGSALDLGCGAGRLSEPLARLGHPVTGVDNEPAMLAALRRTRPVLADITALALGERFHAVLLMSHFVNTADLALVAGILASAARHVRPDGFVVVERFPVGWVPEATERIRTADGVTFTLCDLVRDGEVLTATVRYAFDGSTADQRFSCRDVDDPRLAELAAAAGLRAGPVLDTNGTLVRLDPAHPTGA